MVWVVASDLLVELGQVVSAAAQNASSDLTVVSDCLVGVADPTAVRDQGVEPVRA